jgi:hypothetical protein
VPGAKQSVLVHWLSCLAATDANFYPVEIMNYRLGGGEVEAAHENGTKTPTTLVTVLNLWYKTRQIR